MGSATLSAGSGLSSLPWVTAASLRHKTPLPRPRAGWLRTEVAAGASELRAAKRWLQQNVSRSWERDEEQPSEETRHGAGSSVSARGGPSSLQPPVPA